MWSGVWKILHATPNRKLDDNTLAIELGVQKTAARQYAIELARLGLLNDDRSPTDLAKRWRQDGDDQGITSELLQHAYPSELRELAPPGNIDRTKVERWFLSQGLGQGSAKNKAATYIRIASGVSASNSSGTGLKKPDNGKSEKAKSPSVVKRGQTEPQSPVAQPEERQRPRREPSLNVNLQIHISADASSDQIDSIFSAMKRYFDGSRSY